MVLVPTVEEEDDRSLCSRVAKGEDAAFESLVLRHQHRVYAFCLRLLCDPAEAEDVAQDVFLTVYKNADTFRGESAFTTWLLRIAKNQSLNRIKYLERRGRTTRRSIEELSDDRMLGIEDGVERRPDALIEGGQTAALVQEAIATLGEEHRVVLVLRDVEDLSYEEISQITGLPIGTVKSRIHRGRSVLATRLERIFK
jgi:RNA polymerase sigma-70 factor, ECF subfamily